MFQETPHPLTAQTVLKLAEPQELGHGMELELPETRYLGTVTWQYEGTSTILEVLQVQRLTTITSVTPTHQELEVLLVIALHANTHGISVKDSGQGNIGYSTELLVQERSSFGGPPADYSRMFMRLEIGGSF